MKIAVQKMHRLDLSKEDLIAAIAAYAKVQIPPNADIRSPARSSPSEPLIEVYWSEPA
jgi:hypothetical protein